MNINLTALEARVIGSLIEKAITTPDQYPLSLNALTNACNQKSNRDPVLELDERTVQETLDALARKHMVLERSGFGIELVPFGDQAAHDLLVVGDMLANHEKGGMRVMLEITPAWQA